MSGLSSPHSLPLGRPALIPAMLSLLALSLGLGATPARADDPATPAAAHPHTYLPGYLAPGDLPDSLALLPPPPAPGSAALAEDRAVAQASFQLRGTARWALATADADLSFPHAASTFACALGQPIAQTTTPHLYHLLQRSLSDLGLATRAAKQHYQRPRPFLENGQPICTPEEAAALAKSGSYPSGHTTAGWGWALILSEVAPQRADALLARGLAFGESRNVCNVHWHSDVVQGRTLAAGVVAKLHTAPEFLADLAAARGEVDAQRARGTAPAQDCAAEAQALALPPSLAQ